MHASRAVLAESILQQLLDDAGEDLDVAVASASVGPAPAGDAMILHNCSHEIMLDFRIQACC